MNFIGLCTFPIFCMLELTLFLHGVIILSLIQIVHRNLSTINFVAVQKYALCRLTHSLSEDG